MQCVSSSAQTCSARANHIAVEKRARFHRPFLRFEVDVYDAEAFGVAQGPLEIVEKRPDAIPSQIDAAAHRLARRAEMLAQIVDAQRILHRAVSHRWIVKRRTVFGD